MRSITILLTVFFAIICAAVATGQAQVMVGPNVLVSKGAHAPRTEPILAADPSTQDRLLGATMLIDEQIARAACEIYSSSDGGSTWTRSSVPEQIAFGGADPQVGFGLHGTAYFAAITNGSVERQRGIYFYRSEDGGGSWSKGVFLGVGDHEEIVVDHGADKFAGRVYVAFAQGGPKTGIYVARSEDDGRSFTDPVLAAVDAPFGVNTTNPVLFSDGALFVPFISFETDLVKARDIHTRKLSFVVSNDGGATFSKPIHILEYEFPERARYIDGYRNGSVVEVTFPEFAIDRVGPRFRDRIYLVWSDSRFGQSRILFSCSTDRGNTWSDPRSIFTHVPPASAQFQPAIAVNREGVVGVEWLDTRNSKRGESFEVYFATSSDGGATFGEPTKVSSAPSFPASAGNLKPYAMPARGPDGISLYFLSSFNRWSGGGDYIGLTTDGAGDFHLFWPDARSGTYQTYTANISLSGSGRDQNDAAQARQSITSDVELVFDPVEYSTETREMSVPVRIRNLSNQTLYGPLQVEIKGVVRPDLRPAKMEDLANIPEILNAANMKTGVGAVFDYSQSLGTRDALPPLGITDAVAWRLRFPLPFLTTFYLKAEVTGFLGAKR